MIGNTRLKGTPTWLIVLSVTAMILTCNVTTSGQAPRSSADEGEISSTRSGVISGRVVADGQPVPNASVQLIRLNSPGQMRTVPTDNDGSFRVQGLERGVYRIQVNAPAYAYDSSNYHKGQDLYRIGDSVTINIIRGGVITGKVLNAADEPVVAVRVRALMIRDAKNKRPPVGFLISMERPTDDRGIYRLYGLLPGTYIVSAGGGGYSSYWHGVYHSDTPTYAPSSVRETANEISVGSGEEIKDIDIRYRGEVGHSVSGRVTGVAPPNSPGLGITLFRVHNGVPEAGMSMSTYQSRGGKGFEFNGVADGEYDISAQSGSPGEIALSELRRITVKGSNVTGIELVTKSLPSLAGQIVLVESQATDCKGKRRPLYDEMLVTAQRSRELTPKGQPQFRSYSIGPASPDKVGNFVLSNLTPGRFSVTTRFFAKYWYLQSITLPLPTASNKAEKPATSNQMIDSFRNWIVLKLGERVTGLKIVLAEGAASVQGKVRLPEGEKLPSALHVNLVPADHEKTEEVVRFFAAPVADDGGFILGNVPPGKYFMLVRVTQDAESDLSSRLRFPDGNEIRAKLLRVTDAAKTEIELKPCQNMTDFQLPLKRH